MVVGVCDETQPHYILQCRFEVEVTMRLATGDESTIWNTVQIPFIKSERENPVRAA